MKRLQAFLLAFILFVATVTGMHVLGKKVGFKSATGDFNRWYSRYKDASADALKSNINDKTMIVFGSSEFGHLKKSKYYYANMYSPDKMDVQVIAQPYSQTLNHAIAAGGIGQCVKSKKAVLILSPSWFEGEGVNKSAFQMRFSESLYISLLKNKILSDEIKRELADRVYTLLSDDDKTLERVKLYNKVYLDKDQSLFTLIPARFYERFAEDRENSALRIAMLKHKLFKESITKVYAGQSCDREKSSIKAPVKKKDFVKLWRKANRQARKKSSNEMMMRDREWNKTFRNLYFESEDKHEGESMTISEEYYDLELFLQICKEQGIEVKLVVQPVNGYWYDYTGMSVDEREGFHEIIHQIAKESGVKLQDFGKYDYEPYVVTDAVHPWGKGWLLLNDAIYSFYKNKKPLM